MSRVWHVRLRAECAVLRRIAQERRALVAEDQVAVGILHAIDRVEDAINDLTSPVQFLSCGEWAAAQTPPMSRHTVWRWATTGRFAERDLLRRGTSIRIRAGARPLAETEAAA
jgi:hypothetical protein